MVASSQPYAGGKLGLGRARQRLAEDVGELHRGAPERFHEVTDAATEQARPLS